MGIRRVNVSTESEAHDQWRSAELLAIDTEFHAERGYMPELFLVQIHVPGADTWILDPLDRDRLDAAAAPLTAGATWLLHAGYQDLRLLDRALGGVADTTIDTQVAAGLAGTDYPGGLGRLIARWTGIELPKSATLSDWSRRPLTQDQIAYAAEDVMLLPKLWARLREDLESHGRLEAARLAFAEHRAEALTPPNLHDLWRNSMVAPSLTAPDAAVFRDLMAWRETTAAEQDRPPRSVVGDSTLKQLARGRPTTIGALKANRRLNKRLVARHGEVLLATIATAADAPADTHPWVVRPGTASRRVADWLGVLADVVGSREQWATRLVLPMRTRERLALALGTSRPTLAEILGPWRAMIAGELAADALAGNISLQLASSEKGGDADVSLSGP